jgi:3-oxoacyl-[acyl-carrier-protein] synthase II
VAARIALDDAGLIINDSNADRVGIVVGTCVGGMITYEKNLFTLRKERPDKVSPFFIPGFIPNMAAGEISIVFGAKGASKCVVTACATGSHAIGDALRLIQYFIGEVYNLKGLRLALGCRPLNEFEELLVIQQNKVVMC